MIRTFYILSLAILVGFTACKESPWKAEVPTYLVVDTFELTTFGDQGSNSAAITDVWVYDNTGLLGAYELPAEIPILGDGEKEIVLYPGIRENGNSFYPDIYFLYEPDTVVINASQNGEVQVSASTTYDERTQFAFVEGFESGNIFTQSLTSDSTEMKVIDSMALDGNKCGMIEVSESQSPVVVGTNQGYGPFFQRGNLAYLEMDFKSEVPVTVGYSGITITGEEREFLKVTLKPVEDWRKVYIEFSEEFAGDQIFRVQMVIRADLDPRYTTDTVGRAYFDNLKLIHF